MAKKIFYSYDFSTLLFLMIESKEMQRDNFVSFIYEKLRFDRIRASGKGGGKGAILLNLGKEVIPA